MPRSNSLTLAPFLLLLAAATLLALTYGSLRISSDAAKHYGQQWNAFNIRSYLDCHPDNVQTVKQSNGYEKHFCQINPDMAIGLVIAGGVIIVTGFMAKVAYWCKHR